MTGLAELQRRFQHDLLAGGADVAAELRPGPRTDAATLLAVYRDAYRLRLVEALGDNYPTIAALLGPETFDALGRGYIAAHPSANRSIRWFGDRLAGFLATTAPWRATPALAELAAWEWALRDAFDAADAEPAGLAAMAAVPPAAWPDLTFRPLPSFRRLDLAHDVVAAWRAVADGDEGIPPPPALGQPVAWAIWRPGLVSEYRSLEPDEAWALDRVAEGADFAGLCEGLVRWHDEADVAGRAAGLLHAWLGQGMLTEIVLPADLGLSIEAP